MRTTKLRLFSYLFLAQFALGGCLEIVDPFSDLEDPETIPDSGNSDIGAPTTVIGYTLVQSVEWSDGIEGTITPGNSITYSFIDANTILGEGLNTIATTYWSYEREGTSNKGKLFLDYGDGQGDSTEKLTFTTETSGTYESLINLDADPANNPRRHTGTFIIKPNESAEPTDPNACTSNQGKITIYTTNGSSEDISVYVNGSYSGLLTHYYQPGDKPPCGEPTGIAQVTVTVAPGSYVVSGESASYSWDSSTITVEACKCYTWGFY